MWWHRTNAQHDKHYKNKNKIADKENGPSVKFIWYNLRNLRQIQTVSPAHRGKMRNAIENLSGTLNRRTRISPHFDDYFGDDFGLILKLFLTYFAAGFAFPFLQDEALRVCIFTAVWIGCSLLKLESKMKKHGSIGLVLMEKAVGNGSFGEDNVKGGGVVYCAAFQLFPPLSLFCFLLNLYKMCVTVYQLSIISGVLI